MSFIGSGSDYNVAYTLSARADTRGVAQTAEALTRLERQGATTGAALSTGIDQAAAGFDKARAHADGLKDTLDDVSLKAGLLGGALAAGIGLAVKSFVQFDDQMRAAEAVTGATGDQMGRLRDLALQMGKDTVFSATESASAITELAKAGVSLEAILGGAAQGAANLAAAADIPLPRSAEIIATELNVFNLAADQATHVADVFAAAEVKSAAGAEDIAQALSQAGQVAVQFNIPLEDTVAALALFADEGLKGSDAGTSFRTLLLSMLAPTAAQADAMDRLGLAFFDANGNFIGLAGVAGQLQDHLAGLSQEERNTALTVLFGADAVRAASVLFSAGADGVDAYTAAIGDSEGAAEHMAQTRLGGLGGALESLSGSVETARIEFGENLAPAIKVAAEAIAGAVNAFTSMPESLQTVVVATAATAAGLLLVVAAGAKVASIAISTAQTWKRVGDSFRGTQQACSDTAGCMTAVGRNATTAGEGVGRLTGALRTFAGVAARAVQVAGAIVISDSVVHAVEGAASGPGIADSIANQVEAGIGAGLSGGLGAAIPGLGMLGKPIGDWLQHDAEETLRDQKLFGTVGDLGFKINQTFLGGLLTQTGGSVIEGLGGTTVKDIQDQATAAGVSFEEALSRQAQALGVTTPALDAYRATQAATTAATEDDTAAAQRNAAAVDDQTDSIDAKVAAKLEERRATDELNRAVLAAENAQFIAEQGGRVNPFVAGAEDLRKADEEWNKALDGIIQGTTEAAAIAAGTDIAPDLPGLQRGIAKTSDSAVDLARALDDVGFLNLDPSLREAADFQSALDGVNRKLDETSAAIQQNAADLQMWQGRLDLANSVLDRNAAGLSELDALVAEGRLTQAEANDIQAAAIWLRDRAVGGILDEEAAQARLIPVLAEYIRQHDVAAGAVADLTDKQRGFLAALQQTSVQQDLATLQLLVYLNAMGLVPDEKITQFIVDTSAADPAFAAVAQDLGLLGEGTTVPIDAEADTAQAEADLAGVGANVPPATVAVNADTTAAATAIGSIGANVPPVTVSVQLAAVGFGNAASGDLGIGGAPAVAAPAFTLPAIPNPPPVQITADDQATPTIDGIIATIGTLSDGAEAEGAETSAALAAGIAEGAAAIVEQIGAIRTNLADSFHGVADTARGNGLNIGNAFVGGFAEALGSGTGFIYQAAYAVALSAYLGAKHALGIASPSRQAAELAENFSKTFVDVLRSQQAEAAQAGGDLARSALASMDGGLRNAAFRSVAAPAAPGLVPIVAAGGAGGSRNVTVHAPISISGVSDPQAAADAVVTRLYRTLDRLDLAGSLSA